MIVERERLNVLPGLTGLWQVSGRNNLSFDDMIAIDLEYVKHHSVLWDIKTRIIHQDKQRPAETGS